MKDGHKYTSELPRKMYLYFKTYSEAGAPSFEKFAGVLGITTAELLSFSGRAKFARAMEECKRIRRDRLIDGALMRSYDPSFVKFLLGEEVEGDSEESEIKVSVEVVE